jgi:hypothetical protein
MYLYEQGEYELQKRINDIRARIVKVKFLGEKREELLSLVAEQGLKKLREETDMLGHQVSSGYQTISPPGIASRKIPVTQRTKHKLSRCREIQGEIPEKLMKDVDLLRERCKKTVKFLISKIGKLENQLYLAHSKCKICGGRGIKIACDRCFPQKTIGCSICVNPNEGRAKSDSINFTARHFCKKHMVSNSSTYNKLAEWKHNGCEDIKDTWRY